MKSRGKDTRRLILKKTGTYLRNAIVIFLLTLAALVYGIIFFWNFRQENDKNFTQNDMVHFVQVTGKMDENNYLSLTNKDYRRIYEIENAETKSFTEIAFYQFVGAVEQQTEEPILLVAIDPVHSSYISEEKMQDGIYYTNEHVEKEILNLKIPNVDVDEDGNLHSRESVIVKRPLMHSIKSENESDLLQIRSEDEPVQTIFVTYNTLLEIMKQAGLLEESVKDITSESVPEVLHPSDIIVYIDDMYCIDDCAQALLDDNYLLNYTFEAFDSLSDSLKKSSVFFVVLVILLLATSGINVYLSFCSYLQMQQKDMGILKFYGYSKEQLYNIYKQNINVVFVICFGALLVYLLLLGFLINMDNIWKVIPIMVIFVVVILIILRGLILKLSLKRMVDKEILCLVKSSKEFE
nr:hypothetical protein [Eubacterium sp.]